MKRVTFLFFLGILTVLLLSISKPVKSTEIDDQQAMDILQNMAKTLAEAKQFSLTLHSSFDAPQKNGQMIEFGAVRNIQVKRPDNLRIDLQRSDGKQRTLIFDGKQIIVHNKTGNVYSKAEKVGSVDDAVKYIVSILNIPIPLARMFLTNISDEIEQLVDEIDYVELNILTDVPTYHLAVRSRDVDFQIWIAKGNEPLPKRIVLTYKKFKGEPQFRADFSDWNFSSKAAKGPFAFTPPKNAEQVPLLIPDRTEASIPSQDGGAK